MQGTLLLRLAASCMARLGAGGEVRHKKRFCPTTTHSCSSLLVMGSGSRAPCLEQGGIWGYPGGLREELSKWPGRDSSPR